MVSGLCEGSKGKGRGWKSWKILIMRFDICFKTKISFVVILIILPFTQHISMFGGGGDGSLSIVNVSRIPGTDRPAGPPARNHAY